MLIFEYQCADCMSVFEHLFSGKVNVEDVACISCGSSDINRLKKVLLSPNKNFCPKKKTLVPKKDIRTSLIDVLGVNDAKCHSGCASKFNL